MTLSPIQACMYNILRDRLPHSAEELRRCLYDDLSPASNIRSHLTHIRKQLRQNGRDIICERVPGGARYRIVSIAARAR